MPNFKASFSRTFIEQGEAIIEAEDIDSARDYAHEMLASDSDEISWDNGSLDSDELERVEELDQ